MKKWGEGWRKWKKLRGRGREMIREQKRKGAEMEERKRRE